MKTTKLIIAFVLALFVGKSQCDFTSNITHTNICDGQSVMLTVYGATSYTWSVNGNIFQYGDEFSANFPSEVPTNGAGIYLIKVESCSTSKTITVNVSICTSISEIILENSNTSYYDLQGNIITPRHNEVIIKKIGQKFKKIVIIDTP